MASFTIRCDSALHATRQGQPDWSAALGTADRQVSGYKCGACARLDPPDAVGANRLTIQDRLQAALAANASFLANASPSQGDVLAQVRLLTRQADGLIRAALDDFDDAGGT
jgi:hypothetical protein